jgi:phosphohistidine phosphatase
MFAFTYRNILLWRHADALPLNAEFTEDSDRPLSSKGHLQAKKVANWLATHLSKHTLIVSSSAVRAKQTAQLLSHDIIISEHIVPGASLEAVLKTLDDLSMQNQGQSDLLIVGHQPWLGELAAYLLDIKQSQPTGALNIKKGAVWWFKISTTTDSTYNLYCLQTPRLL